MLNDETLAELGEAEAIRRIVPLLGVASSAVVGSGDDAAVLRVSGELVVSTDTMRESADFRLDWSSAEDIGYKAAASNLADVAAMGAKPTALLVALIAPAETRISWLEGFARGLAAGCEQLAPGTAVVGGDLAAGPTLTVAVTALGEVAAGAAVTRAGAKPSDRLALAGQLGRAACGLELLRLDMARAFDEFAEAQRRPQPPVSLGLAAALAGATAMLDLSDSLSLDALRIAEASGVSLEINPSYLLGYRAMLEQPAQAIAARLGDPAVTTESLTEAWVLHGGEDHGLLASFPVSSQLPRGFKEIGTVLEANESPRLYYGNEELSARGWDSVRLTGDPTHHSL